MAQFGSVYVFNLYVENMTALGINVLVSAGAINAPVSTTTPPYVPQQLAVTRTNLFKSQLTSPMFVDGANTVSCFFSTGQNFSGTVTIPDPPALSNDLWLYIAVTQDNPPGVLNGIAFLFDTVGNMLPQIGPGTVGGAAILKSGAGEALTEQGPASDKGHEPPLGGGGGVKEKY